MIGQLGIVALRPIRSKSAAWSRTPSGQATRKREPENRGMPRESRAAPHCCSRRSRPRPGLPSGTLVLFESQKVGHHLTGMGVCRQTVDHRDLSQWFRQFLHIVMCAVVRIIMASTKCGPAPVRCRRWSRRGQAAAPGAGHGQGLAAELAHGRPSNRHARCASTASRRSSPAACRSSGGSASSARLGDRPSRAAFIVMLASRIARRVSCV